LTRSVALVRKYEERREGRRRRRRRRKNRRKKNLAEVATPLTYSGDIPVRIQARN